MSELSRLRWLCRRGMKELDVVTSAYLEHHYTTATPQEQAQFEALLELTDPELYRLLLGRGQAAEAELLPLLTKMRGFSANAQQGA